MSPSNRMGVADSTSLSHAWAEAGDRTEIVATYLNRAVAGDLGLDIPWASMWLGAARHEGWVTPCCCTPPDRAASVAGAGITHHQANSCPSLPTRPFQDKHTPKLPFQSSSIYLSARILTPPSTLHHSKVTASVPASCLHKPSRTLHLHTHFHVPRLHLRTFAPTHSATISKTPVPLPSPSSTWPIPLPLRTRRTRCLRDPEVGLTH